jgi:translation initiation factor 3 subunit D
MPYQPFNKSDKLGKVADWTGLTYTDRKLAHKYSSHFATGAQYAYIMDEDEGKTFSLKKIELTSLKKKGCR